ncbi:maltose alpha-D-glucosyltransferase [Granulicella tundricola]|uniref:Maltokinase n=1 Tax=Granulicella tundricola (strain ATCC BAA-1859 / DSM 23138 / MP5ACTX9) TaxID=1198114 RepID=E8WYZ2_GRATM|nr:maltose alpha-D-glucosyltransferase [Granulicella tundricola]ADW69907.1 trehalose synthase [Granulicella tundricola MP5ACTX9]
MKKLGSASDPLWYKDAIIYEIHVRAFADSNNDGIGDFPGLMSKLDYLQDLGVTCLWLLPFFPSPLRDDGYDIANYVDVNPSYGTLNDFKLFIDAAHKRGMQVMIELVINHTSDQHPWFKAARLAPPGSPEREMYVWSETDLLYQGVRIIFTDTEKSNWTWDDQAKAFYWHRFFSHQPDLNFDNPRVMEEVLKAMRFWLDLGVDALRLDAIPYLIERDGTNCENVPETHVKIKEIRAALDVEYGNRLILAEANMWPADVRPYFGDGDECHMAFHFPLMPRIYMALRQEDRLPITDIMAQTPDIPESCQWGLFLRNHDELTLEMVTDDERDYMYLAYSADPRMRINVGIRRRLAPLVDNNRRRIELLNSLLLSFPGTPIMYYGDEIGMGDNIYLGDRNGVRTPMQWNSDRNAGFSKCDPARLYFPVVMDPIYGYQVVNVEAQLSDQSSLLHWTRNMIALRKLFQVFGRGTLEFLHPENRKVLAYLRDLKRDDGTHETVLCVANLSRFAQPVALDLTTYAGMMPVEMLGYVSFPQIGKTPYALTVAPYSFLWFELQPAPVEIEEPMDVTPGAREEGEQVALDLLTKGWAGLVSGPGATLLETALPGWLSRQRWFGAKTRTIQTVRIAEWVQIPAGAGEILPTSKLPAANTLGDALLFLDIVYADSSKDTYQLPISYTTGHAAEELRAAAPLSVIATLSTPTGSAMLHDASTREDLRQALLTMIGDEATLALGNAASAGREIATTLIAAHTGRPAHEIGAKDTEVQEIAGKIAQEHSIEVADVAPEFIGAMPGAENPSMTQVFGGAESASAANGAAGQLKAYKSSAFDAARGTAALPSRTGSAEQSNTNFLYDQTLLMKLFRRLQPGLNPDVEIGRFLTEVAHFPRIAPFLGELTMVDSQGETTTLAMLQGMVSNEGDGWQWTLEELARFYESVSACPIPANQGKLPRYGNEGVTPEDAKQHLGLYLEAAALLGRRTAEMHLALATATDNAAFAAEAFTSEDLALDAKRIDTQISQTLEALKHGMQALKDLTADDAATILSRRIELFSRAHAIAAGTPAGKRIRIHGDYHLGQILRAKNDFVILDFEGEPARTLEERRRKQSPLKDVAGMMRSFSYAAWSGLDQYALRHPDQARSFEPWARLWENSVATEFLRAYRQTMETDATLLPDAAQADSLLSAYLLEKALYELLYELNNRPTWVRIPLAGILALPKPVA